MVSLFSKTLTECAVKEIPIGNNTVSASLCVPENNKVDNKTIN